jgi:hypothetical protein
LDRQKVPTFGHTESWDPSTVDNFLRNRAVLGEHQPRSYSGGSKKGVPIGEVVQNYYPAVIDRMTFETAQQARKSNLENGRGRKGNDLANLFGRLITCSYCGAIVKFHSNGQAKSLICTSVLNGGSCIRAGWSYRNFEESVFHFIAHPAFLSAHKREERNVLDEIVRHKNEMMGDGAHNARLAAAILFKRATSLLEIACAGDDPSPTLPESQIRRDRPARYFRIRLWEGKVYRGTPVPPIA